MEIFNWTFFYWPINTYCGNWYIHWQIREHHGAYFSWNFLETSNAQIHLDKLYQTFGRERKSKNERNTEYFFFKLPFKSDIHWQLKICHAKIVICKLQTQRNIRFTANFKPHHDVPIEMFDKMFLINAVMGPQFNI